MLNKFAPYILAVALFIFGLSLGFFAGRTSPKSGIMPAREEKPEVNQLYSSQTASIRGEIIKREGSNLTVKNLNNGKEGVIKASSRVLIAKLAENSKKAATPSSNLSTIDLNQEVLITLERANGEYEATLIQYVLPTPSLPPLPKP